MCKSSLLLLTSMGRDGEGKWRINVEILWAGGIFSRLVVGEIKAENRTTILPNLGREECARADSVSKICRNVDR